MRRLMDCSAGGSRRPWSLPGVAYFWRDGRDVQPIIGSTSTALRRRTRGSSPARVDDWLRHTHNGGTMVGRARVAVLLEAATVDAERRVVFRHVGTNTTWLAITSVRSPLSDMIVLTTYRTSRRPARRRSDSLCLKWSASFRCWGVDHAEDTNCVGYADGGVCLGDCSRYARDDAHWVPTTTARPEMDRLERQRARTPFLEEKVRTNLNRAGIVGGINDT